MPTKSRSTICVTRHVKVLPERIFDAWTHPDEAWQWMAHVNGEVVSVEVDPRIHGTVRQVVRREGREIEHTGRYVELVRPRRLAFTWQGPRSSNENGLVKLEFAAAGKGTDLILTHEGVPQGHESHTMRNWSAVLDAISSKLHPSEG